MTNIHTKQIKYILKMTIEFSKFLYMRTKNPKKANLIDQILKAIIVYYLLYSLYNVKIKKK